MQPDLGPVIGGVEPMKSVRRPAPWPEPEPCALMGAASVVLQIVIVFGCVCIAALFGLVLWGLFMLSAKPSLAQSHHDHHHAFYQGWVNKDGKGCCNDQDCGELPEGDERETGGVLEVKVEGQWCPVLPKHYLGKGNVPNASVSHVCVLRKSEAYPGGPCERFICYQPQPRM